LISLNLKAAKNILDLPSFSSLMQALEALAWQTLAKRRLLHCYVVIYNYVNGLIDFIFVIAIQWPL